MNIDYTEKLILQLCVQPRSLDYISQHTDGIDPISTLNFLRQLEEQNKVRSQDDLWLIEDKARMDLSDLLNPDPHVYLKKYMGEFFDLFKKPHPLDFEWRNSIKSVNYLSELVLESNQITDDILILGMPTLFANLCKRDLIQRLTIVERNEAIINQLKELAHGNAKVISNNIFTIDPDSVGMYSTVIMDPPWYPEHFYQFIWLASRCLKLGGRLIISIPPINTRPGIDKERISWFSFCQSQGLCLENLYAKRLKYLMPFFEWNSIRSAGASASPFWRNGDLAIFKKLQMTYIDRPDLKEEEDHWKEIEINTIRIRIKIENSTYLDSFEINQLTNTGILASVSSREPLRKKANVWTSGNRIYFCNDSKKLYTYLQFIKEGIKENSAEFQIAFGFVELISRLESEEYNNYLEWLYHDMEKEII